VAGKSVENSVLRHGPAHQFDSDFAALGAGAAARIVKKGVRPVGFDSLSVQLFKDAESRTHQILLKAGVIIVEGLDF
jgi:kynurenine formamidase